MRHLNKSGVRHSVEAALVEVLGVGRVGGQEVREVVVGQVSVHGSTHGREAIARVSTPRNSNNARTAATRAQTAAPANTVCSWAIPASRSRCSKASHRLVVPPQTWSAPELKLFECSFRFDRGRNQCFRLTLQRNHRPVGIRTR